MLNATPLLKQFLKDIDLTPAQKMKLENAKQTVRSTLRKAFKDAGREIHDQSGKTVAQKPKFWPQGSIAYKTANQPAYPPKQQIDIDDGTYLPMSFMDEMTPSVASSLFFAFVDRVLENLAVSKDWAFDGSKKTCVRLILDQESHIDVPLYAIPDDEFNLLEAKMNVASEGQIAAFSVNDNMYIEPDRVQLAHRDEGWKASDPRKIHKWFLTKVQHHGNDNQLRRICRLIKAWRDNHDDLDGLTSILLMVAVTEIYDGHDEMPKRDDLALLIVADELPHILSRDIYNPAEPDESLSARVPTAVLRKATDRMWNLRQDINGTLNSYSQDAALSRIRDHFGTRVPERPDLILIDSARVEVEKHPAATMAMAAIIPSKSG
ncbi:MAG: hypothetical protein COB46_07670 [Rhodospirillaceae bacterium]|nr:MAG: hypothetical protein COB46_07670 [Rhodospirillaceae bacterium]